MTIETTANSVTGNGNGATTIWPYSFLIPFGDDGITPAVLVTLTNTNVTPYTYTVLSAGQYAIAGVGDHVGGTVTYTPALVAGWRITIARNMTLTQGTEILNQGFFPRTVEQIADTLVMEIQQVQSVASRAIHAPAVEGQPDLVLPAVSARAGLYLAFDGSGNPVALPAVNTFPADISLFTAIASGGTFARSLANFFGGLLSVKDFGARGDGVTNDTTALTAALASGHDLFVPEGVYVISDSLTLAGAYQRLVGFGLLSEFRWANGSSKPGLIVTGERASVVGVYLHGLSNTSKTVSNRAPGVVYQLCRITNETVGAHCLYNEDEGSGVFSFGLTVRDTFIYGSLVSGALGLRLGLNSQAAKITGGAIENCGTLISVEDATENVVIEGVILERSVDYAISLSKGGATPLMAAIAINRNYFEENQVCIRLHGGQFNNISITNNLATRNTVSKPSSYFYLAEVGASAASDDILITDNYIEDFATVFTLVGEYSSNVRKTQNNTVVNCTLYADFTYAELAYNMRTLNSYYTRKLISGSFVSESNLHLEALTAVFEQPVIWQPQEYLEKITFNYAQVGSTGVTIELRSLTSNGITDALVATSGLQNTDGVKTITVGGYANPALNYYLKVTYNGVGTSGNVYPFRLFIH